MNRFKNEVVSFDSSVFDYWMRDLTHSEFKLLVTIYRKTESVGKGFKRISQLEIANITGLTTRSIITALRSLEGKGIITSIGETRAMKNYSINTDMLYNVCLNIDNFKKARVYGASRAIIPQVVKSKVFENDFYRCVNCGTHKDLTLDHILPVSKGGNDEIENLQTLCKPCNISKGDKTMEEWLSN